MGRSAGASNSDFESKHPRARGRWTVKGFTERDLAKMSSHEILAALGLKGGGGAAPAPRAARPTTTVKPVPPARAGSSAKGAAGKPEKARPVAASAVERRVREVEHRELLPLKNEKCVIFSAAGQRLLEKKSRSAHEVTIDVSGADAARMRGGLFTHNHPNGMSLTVDDARLASIAGVAEVRAVGRPRAGDAAGRAVVYRLAPPSGGKWPALRAINAAHAKHDAAVEEKFTAEILAGRLPLHHAEAMHDHEVWTLAAKELGLTYERIQLD